MEVKFLFAIKDRNAFAIAEYSHAELAYSCNKIRSQVDDVKGLQLCSSFSFLMLSGMAA
jgi:hypothetical protein